MRSFQEHTNRGVAAVACSDRRIFFSGGRDGAIVKMDVLFLPRFFIKRKVHNSLLGRIALGATFIVSANYDENVLKMWNMDLEPTQTLVGHEQNLWSVAVHPNSTMIVSGNDGGEVKVWKEGEGEKWACTKTLKDHADEVRTVVFSPNGELLATGSKDKTIKVYSVANDFSCIHTLEEHTRIINSLSPSPSTVLASSPAVTIIRSACGHTECDGRNVAEESRQRAHRLHRYRRLFAQREPASQLQ